MTIEQLPNPENLVQNAQNRNDSMGMQIEMLRQAMGVSTNSIQNQLLQLVSNLPNLQQVQTQAQSQISKGFLDIKI